MASPFTAAETSQLYEIFGIPENGVGFVVGRLISLYGPAGNTYDFSRIVTQLTTQLGTVTASQYTRCQAVIQQWDTLGLSYSEIKIAGDQRTTGTIIDVDKQRRNIRRTLSKLIGFFVPDGGFWADASIVWSGNQGGRVMR